MGMFIGPHLCAKWNLNPITTYSIADIIAAACVAHDIGNPPFGHSGEDSIRTWFSRSENSQYLQGLSTMQQAEFLSFEGNAQGFRILTKLQRHRKSDEETGGLQLTMATLGASLKYPRRALLSKQDKKRVSQKKFQFCESEESAFLQVVKTLGLKETLKGEAWSRHPLVYLVEAADDVSYTIADFQDGFRLGHVSWDVIFSYFERILGVGSNSALKESLRMREAKDRVEYLGGKVIGHLVKEICSTFLENEEKILEGSFDQPLISQIDSKGVLQEMMDFAHREIYSAPEVINIKVAGFEAIQGLLDAFVPAICLDKNGSERERFALFKQLIPRQFLEEEEQSEPRTYQQLQQVTDYISGMTDSYAISLFRRLKGIEI
jgi:dGTPase